MTEKKVRKKGKKRKKGNEEIKEAFVRSIQSRIWQQVFAVGIGKVNLEELGEIATANTPDYVFKVANFDELRNQGPFIVLQACKGSH